MKDPISIAHYAYRSQLTLNSSAGRVSRFNLAESVSYKGREENACTIRLEDLGHMPSTLDLMLRADGDEDALLGTNRTVHIVGNDYLLWVRMGDSSRIGDDCRQTEETMFCSVRGMWSDLVIDR